MPKILIVTTQWFGAPTGGGIGRPTTALSRALTAQGHQVHTVLARNPSSLRALPRSTSDKHSVSKITSSQSHFVFPFYLSDQWRIAEFIHRQSPDVVIAQEWQGLASVFSSQARRPPLISWLHGGTTYDYHGRGSYFPSPLVALDAELERVQIETSELVVAPSQFILDLYSKDYEMALPTSRVVPYHFPEGLSESSYVRKGPPNLVFMGRLSLRKGFDVFLDACMEAKEFFGEISVQIAGESIDFSGHDGARKLRLAGVKATYLGLRSPQSTWHEVSRRNSMLIVTSRLDNSPNTVYESIAHGIPVLVIGEMNGANELSNFSNLVQHHPAGANIDWSRVSWANQNYLHADIEKINEEISAQWDSVLRDLRKVFLRNNHQSTNSKKPGKVSVIVPTRNRREFLDRVLGSLSSQEQLPSEVVIVDDASDSDYAISFSNADYPFDLVVVRNFVQRGPGASRNAGFQASSGEIICFVDDDNLLSPNHIKECVETIASGADFVVSQHAAFESGKKEKTTVVFLGSSGHSISDFHNLVGDSHFACRRQSFEQLDGFVESLEMAGEDFLLLSDAAKKGFKIKPLNHETVYYRVNEDGVEATGRHKFLTLYKRDRGRGLVAQIAVRRAASATASARHRSLIVRMALHVLSPFPSLYSFASTVFRKLKNYRKAFLPMKT